MASRPMPVMPKGSKLRPSSRRIRQYRHDEHAARRAEHGVLERRLCDEARARRAERDADADLFDALVRAREQQVADVDAEARGYE